MTTEQTEAEFIQRILDQPRNENAYLAYAAWLDEQGDSRGAFIRAQLEEERLPRLEGCVAEREIWRRHRDEWLAPLKPLGVTFVGYRRGMPNDLHLKAAIFPPNAPRIFDLAPTTRFLTLDWNDAENACPINLARAIAALPQLHRIKALSLRGNWSGVAVAALLASPQFEELVELDLSDTRFGPDDLATAIQAPLFSQLKNLSLAGNPLGEEGALHFCNPPRSTSALQSLDLDETGFTDEAAMRLAQSKYMANLQELSLVNNPLSNLGVEALLNSGILKATNLHVSDEHLPKPLQARLDYRSRQLGKQHHARN